jgi:hypothetical protein
MDKRRRVVVEVSEDVHRELRKTALLNDLKLYELTNACLEEFLKDSERVRAVVRQLKVQGNVS